jgi:signal transduction histidine kinase
MSSSTASPQARAASRRFLIADDDPILREIMRERLADAETGITCVENGREAWERLSREVYDLAVVDLGMPELDGFGLIAHLRQTPRTVDLPIIVATSRDDGEAIEKAYAAGATSFVTKPVNWPLFHHQVRFVLRSGRIEHDLRQARAVADVASRTKDSLFHLLSHELRTPLNVLVGFAALLERELGERLSPDERRHLDDMQAAAHGLNEIVGNVLTYARLLGATLDVERDALDVDELLENCAITLRRKAKEKGVQIVVRRPPERLMLMADGRWLADALARLLDNAVKFSPAGGTVELMAVDQGDGSLTITVRDNGPGMEPRRIEEYLQPFSQGDMSFTRRAEGLGMGLAIAKRIMELHGGKLVFRSNPGEGTVAGLWLPGAGRASAALARAG